LIHKAVWSALRHECGVGPAEPVLATLDVAHCASFDDSDGFVKAVNVAWQRCSRLKQTIATTDSNGTKTLRKQVAEESAFGEFIDFGAIETVDEFRICVPGVTPASILRHKRCFHHRARVSFRCQRPMHYQFGRRGIRDAMSHTSRDMNTVISCDPIATSSHRNLALAAQDRDCFTEIVCMIGQLGARTKGRCSCADTSGATRLGDENPDGNPGEKLLHR
jgi:hypothetical protein